MNKLKKLLNRPVVSKWCYKYSLLGKLLCKLNLDHSLILTGFNPQTLHTTAKCKYCGKQFESKRVN